MAAKFKKGDRVLWTRATGFDNAVVEAYDPREGRPYTIAQGTERTYATEDELVPVAEATGTVKIGDKVVILDNKTLGGATIKEYPVGSILTIERTCSDADGNEAYLFAGHHQYLRRTQIEPVTEPTLTIEAGRHYKTRDGRKVGPLTQNDDMPHLFGAPQIGISHNAQWYDTGRALSYGEHPSDIIAEWVDEQQPANDNSTAGFTIPILDDEPQADTNLHIKFTGDFSELDAEIDRVKRRLKKLAKKARKLGINLEYDDGGLEDADSWRAA